MRVFFAACSCIDKAKAKADRAADIATTRAANAEIAKVKAQEAWDKVKTAKPEDKAAAEKEANKLQKAADKAIGWAAKGKAAADKAADEAKEAADRVVDT